MIDVAIVGMGAWGMCVLERAISRARHSDQRIRVHVIEPATIGGVAYTADQPDFLVLNNACGQLSLYAAPDPGHVPGYGMGLYDWAVWRGYRWVGDECRIGTDGDPITPGDYLPRRLMGEYLAWFYRTAVRELPANMELFRYHSAAVDIMPMANRRERVVLADGRTIVAEHVVLTSGHTPNRDQLGGGVRPRDPYPISVLAHSPGPGEQIAVSGMGLVAYDIIAALTTGRGGRFVGRGNRRAYLPSGREPVINLFSRSGMPYCAKSVTATDPTGDYRPVVCTSEVFASLRTSGSGALARRTVDLRGELLPLIYAEMRARYYLQSALIVGGAADEAAVRTTLSTAWRRGNYDNAIAGLALRYGTFEPSDHLFAGADSHYASSEDYEKQFYVRVQEDLDEALAPQGSPIKAAQEVLRILRDPIRSVIEFGGLSLDSYLDFKRNVKGRVNRLEAGPPVQRSQQLLALMDAGIVRAPFGPDPEVGEDASGAVTLRSTRLDIPVTATVSTLLRGHLSMPSLAHSASPLLNRLYRTGRLTQLQYGDTAVGSVALDEDSHPYDAEARPQRSISVFGVLTEGARYFTHYLPSPKSRIRAVVDAQTCIDNVLHNGR